MLASFLGVLPMFIKVPLKEEEGLFAFCLWLLIWRALGLGFWGLWLDSFALGFLVWEAFGREKNY
jgi:hypothetical protein